MEPAASGCLQKDHGRTLEAKMGWITLKDKDGVFHHVLLGDEDAGEGATGFDFAAGRQANGKQQSESTQKRRSTPNQDSAEAYDNPQNEREARLANVIYNETASLRPDPSAAPGAPGSAEDLEHARTALAEVANRVIQSGYPKRVAPSDLYWTQVKAINDGNRDAISAHNASLAAARAALAGSNTTGGATQYRLPLLTKSTEVINRRSVTHRFGPFYDSAKGTSRKIIIAP